MRKITENTLFVNGGESLGLTMLDFWKYQYGNIYQYFVKNLTII